MRERQLTAGRERREREGVKKVRERARESEKERERRERGDTREVALEKVAQLLSRPFVGDKPLQIAATTTTTTTAEAATATTTTTKTTATTTSSAAKRFVALHEGRRNWRRSTNPP